MHLPPENVNPVEHWQELVDGCHVAGVGQVQSSLPGAEVEPEPQAVQGVPPPAPKNPLLHLQPPAPSISEPAGHEATHLPPSQRPVAQEEPSKQSPPVDVLQTPPEAVFPAPHEQVFDAEPDHVAPIGVSQ